jgi:hypothetical protein
MSSVSGVVWTILYITMFSRVCITDFVPQNESDPVLQNTWNYAGEWIWTIQNQRIRNSTYRSLVYNRNTDRAMLFHRPHSTHVTNITSWSSKQIRTEFKHTHTPCAIYFYLPARVDMLHTASRKTIRFALQFFLVVTSPLCLIYANEKEGMVSQNTTAIFAGAFYLGWRQHVSALALSHLQVLSGVSEESYTV